MPDDAQERRTAAPDDPHRGPRWLRSVRRRPSAFLCLVALSALAVLVSVLTPMLLRSTQAVALAQSVATAPYAGSHVVGVAQSSDTAELGEAYSGAEQITAALRAPGTWDAAVTAAESLDAFKWQVGLGGTIREAWLSAVPDGCAGVTLTAGRCPAKDGDALFPASTAVASKVEVGSRITLNPTGYSHLLTIVGFYDDRRGSGVVIARPVALSGEGITRPLPAIAVGQSGAQSVTADWNVWSARRLRDPVGLEEIGGIERDLGRASAATLSSTNADVSGQVSTGIRALLGRNAADETASGVMTGAIALQALGLAWFALAAVIGRISRGRAPEWGIGRTRGVPRATWLAAVFLEPTIAVVLGAVLGAVGGIGLASLAARIALGAGTAVDPAQPLVLAAGGLALGGSLVAIVAASVRSARLPLPSLLRETTEPRQLSRLALVAQAGAVLVAAVVLWVVITQPLTGVTQIGLLAPALVALVVALAALRVAVVVVRGGTSRATRSLAGLVVGRQLARAPSVLSSAVLVTVGTALVAYTLQVGLVADRLAVAQADAAVGASTVLTVSTPTGLDLVQAVRRADPSGRAAAAAAEVPGVSTNRVVAVDTARLAAVTSWRTIWRGAAPSTLHARLDPAVGPDLVLRGTTLSLTISDLGDGGDQGLPAADMPAVQLAAVVAAADRWITVPFGDLRDGVLTSAKGAFPCSAGCRLVSIGISDPAVPPVPYGASFQLAGIATNTQPAGTLRAWTTEKARWRQRIATDSDPTFTARASIDTASDGILLTLVDESGDLNPRVEPATGPAELPVLLASSAAVSRFAGLSGVLFGTDFASAPLLVKTVGTAPVLPRALNDGVLADLSQMRRISDPSLAKATQEVWLAPGVHADVIARLRAEGVRVTARQTLGGTITANERRAPPRALRLALVTAGAAMLLTLLALVAARIAGVPAKLRDWRTLRATGVPPRRLRWLAVVDLAAPAAIGAVLGVLAAACAYLVSAQRLPLIPSGVGNPPADLTLSAGPLILLAAGIVAVIAVIGVVGAITEIRRSGDD